MTLRARQLEQHRHLRRCRDHVVQFLDGPVERARPHDLARDGVGTSDRYDVRSRVKLDALDESGPHAVNDVVRDKRREDLRTQAVCRDELRIAASQHLREIAHRVRFQEVLEGFLVRRQCVVNVDLRVAQHDGKFRAGHALFACLALLDFYFVRQVLQAAVEKTASLETADYPADLVGPFQGPYLAHAERLRLQVVVSQNIVGHVVGHQGEQFIALIARHALLLGDVGQQDLDVHLAVGRVDTCGVIDEVGVDATAIEAEFDAPALRQPEIATLADDLAAQLTGIDADIVIAAIADICVAFGGGFHVSADATVPQQVGAHTEDRPNQFVGLHRCLVRVEHRPCFLTQANGLRLPGEHPAALGNDLVFVVRPAGTR